MSVKEVSISISRTINLQNYESLKVEAGGVYSVAGDVKSVQRSYEDLYEEVDTALQIVILDQLKAINEDKEYRKKNRK